MEYLRSGDPLDATGRWEGVLNWVLCAAGAPYLR
jgi:hypothetical protein